MATVKNFGLAGVNANVQYGKGNGRVKYDTDHFEVRNAADAALIELYVATPVGGSNANSAASKEYVDSVAAGLDPKESVIAATTQSFTAQTGTVPTQSGAGVGATLTNAGTQLAFAVDGVTVAETERVLVKDQVDASQNGIYTVTDAGSGATNWVLTRATDQDGTPANEVSGGNFTFVESGTLFADTGWVVSSPTGNATVDTTDIVWTQFSAAGLISVSGTAGEIDIIHVGNDYQVGIDTNYVGQVSITTLGTIGTGTWQGTTIAIDQGGTGQTVLDDILVDGSGRLSVSNGAGTVIGGDVTLDVVEANLDLDSIGGTLTLTAAAGHVTGILPVPNGGTGLGTITPNGILFGSTLDPVGVTAAGAEGTLLRAGVSGTPAFTTLTMPATIAANSLFAANDANTLVAITAADGGGNRLLEWNDTSNDFSFVTSDSIGGFKFKTITGDTGSAVAELVEDTVKMVGGAGITTVAASTPDTVTFDMDTTGLTLLTGATLDATADMFFVTDGGVGTNVARVTAQSIVDASTINIFTQITGDGGVANVDAETDSLNFTGAEGIITTASDITNVADVDIALALWEINDAGMGAGDKIVFADGGATNGAITVTSFISTFGIVEDTDFGSQGIMTSDGSGTYTMRNVVANSATDQGISVGNGDGSGNITIGVSINGQAANAGDLGATDRLLMWDGANNVYITGQEIADGVATLTNDDRIVSPDTFTTAIVDDTGKFIISTEDEATTGSNTFATFDTTKDNLEFNFTNSVGEIEIQAGDGTNFGGSSTDVDIRFTPGGNGEVIFGAAGTDATLTSSSGTSGENFVILAGDGSAGDGGDITLTPGTGTGADGNVCITDADSNNVMCFEGLASSANYISLTNAATGLAPTFSIVGEANIDIGFLPAGTGVLSVLGTTDYETNVTADDDIPNRKFVVDADAAVLSGSISSFKFNVLLNADGDTASGETIPAGATVIRVYMNVSVADSSATLTVGQASDEYAAVATNDPSATGLYVADLFSVTVGTLKATVASTSGVPVASAVVGDVPGTGYTTGDTVEVLGGTLGTAGAATFTVTAAAGLITGLAVLSAGGYSVAPTLDENVLTVLTGGGDGFATADITMGTNTGSADVIVEYKNA